MGYPLNRIINSLHADGCRLTPLKGINQAAIIPKAGLHQNQDLRYSNRDETLS